MRMYREHGYHVYSDDEFDIHAGQFTALIIKVENKKENDIFNIFLGEQVTFDKFINALLECGKVKDAILAKLSSNNLDAKNGDVPVQS